VNLRLRLASVGAVLAIFSYLVIANFVPQEQRVASPLLPDQGLRLGLDLQGGIHWVIGVELAAAEQRELEFQRDQLARHLEEEQAALAAVEARDGALVLVGASAAALDAARKWAQQTGLLDSRPGEPPSFALSEPWKREVRNNGMSQVLEVLRRRIEDPIQGIPEAVVTRQGDDRVLVQIPGGQIDRARARELLRVTGFLEFKIAKDTAASEELLRVKYPQGLPPGTEIVFEHDKETDRVVAAYLVPEKPDVTGDYLSDARVSFDQRQRPEVSFTFNPQGGELFQALTSENLGERLAIILDKHVYSAPTIQARISMRGVITGRFTTQEAADLAVVLRAGSLSVPVVIEEERTVGPTLGKDSIDRGVRASLVGSALVVLFMVGYYRLSGVYSSLALLANMVVLIGMMSLFGATLTMPGLAGVVLTVGMAVDGNVIIFERIREELRAGKLARAAIATGFNRAFWTIVDSNATTLITALALYQYGTGPIKGFAVTLAIGLLINVPMVFVVTRLMYDVYPGRRPVESLSI
jgi:preprotein translocase subunit SecD